MEQSTFPARFLQWFFAFFIMHLVARGLSAMMVPDGFAHAPALWARAIMSDCAAAIFLALLAADLARFFKPFPWAFMAVWASVLAGNREYIGDWQSNLSVFDIAMLGDPTFLEGSVFTQRLLLTAVALYGVGYVCYGLIKRFAHTFPSTRALYLYAIAGVLVGFLPVTPPQLWSQQNVLEENAHQIMATFVPNQTRSSPVALNEAKRFLVKMRQQDLQGELFITQRPRANILIVSIESLSDPILQNGWMPYLQSLAAGNLYYTQYINPNLTTIRGMFTQLCGRETWWARFGKDRIAAQIKRQDMRCLPQLLNERGYATVYMQSADLGFQDKVHVMANMDFGDVIGNTPETEGNRFSEWGVDDPSLFINAEKKIEALEKENPERPWMVTLLTAGTHHPYAVDPSFGNQYPLRERAFRYTDQGIKQLVEWLQATGRDQNTLLIITGDESREARKADTKIGRVITRNQGVMVIASPGKEKKRVIQSFIQSDLPLSVLDFIDAVPPRVPGGRSLFREYRTFRPIAFGDYSQNFLYAFWHPDELTLCYTVNWDCSRYILTRPLFDPRQVFTPTAVEHHAMRALFEENERYWFNK